LNQGAGLDDRKIPSRGIAIIRPGISKRYKSARHCIIKLDCSNPQLKQSSKYSLKIVVDMLLGTKIPKDKKVFDGIFSV